MRHYDKELRKDFRKCDIANKHISEIMKKKRGLIRVMTPRSAQSILDSVEI